MSGLTTEERDFLWTYGKQLLRQSGVGEVRDFERLSGGRNNRVFRVLTSDGSVVLKWYFQNSQDDRNRLTSEYTFCEYGQHIGLDCLPQPIARDDDQGLAVYSEIDGRAVQHKAIAHLFGIGDHAARVGAVVRLGEAEAANPLARRQLRQVLLPLRFVAVSMNRMHDQR